MARYSAAIPTWTPTATADTTNLVDNSHQTIQGVASTRFELREIYLGGQATSSAPTFMVAGRTSTVGATLTGGRMASMEAHSNAPAALPTSYAVATTKLQRSATLGMLLNLSFNAFGGIVRWVNGPDEIISCFGASATLGELSLNAFTGGTAGLLGSNIVIDVA